MSWREMRPSIAVRKIDCNVVYRLTLAQKKAEALEVERNVRHCDPPRILLIENRGCIKSPSRIFDSVRRIGPAMTDKLIHTFKKVTIGLGFHIQRCRAKNW